MEQSEKDLQIADLQNRKAILKDQVAAMFKRSTDLYHLHKAAELKYEELKKQYEALDREEKFLTLSITRKMLKDPKAAKPAKEKKEITINSAEQALKALNNLPAAVRMAILAKFKTEEKPVNKEESIDETIETDEIDEIEDFDDSDDDYSDMTINEAIDELVESVDDSSPSTLTCDDCAERHECEYANDPYNTNGDCLACSFD